LFPLESEAVVPLDSSNFHQTSSPAASADPATPSATPTAITAINFRCLFMVCPFCCFAVLLFSEAERIKIAYGQRECAGGIKE
jgi:hypothetical protein